MNLGAAADDSSLVSNDDSFFREQVEPILKRYCFECHSHSAGQMEGGLTLDSRSGWLAGGDRGPALVPNKPAESLLVHAIRRTDEDLRMPPDRATAAASG